MKAAFSHCPHSIKSLLPPFWYPHVISSTSPFWTLDWTMDWNMDWTIWTQFYSQYFQSIISRLWWQARQGEAYSSPHRCQQSLLLYSTSCIILVRSSTQTLLVVVHIAYSPWSSPESRVQHLLCPPFRLIFWESGQVDNILQSFQYCRRPAKWKHAIPAWTPLPVGQLLTLILHACNWVRSSHDCMGYVYACA